MKRRQEYAAHSARVTGSKRWKGLRLQALRRDGFRCRSCGVAGRLEVDHIEPVRDAPSRAYELANLQSLCRGCHSRKTREEVGMNPVPPERAAWRNLVRKTGRNPNKRED
ncbi:MAG: HNH endonuclease [Rhodobacteraceae bacterium]|jgi:5-methylcytosine-specific restriction endonuclease McrA|nr:HNH endonuclease [Paracoccaceae bacterium]